jgi:hypothetical protein
MNWQMEQGRAVAPAHISKNAKIVFEFVGNRSCDRASPARGLRLYRDKHDTIAEDDVASCTSSGIH